MVLEQYPVIGGVMRVDVNPPAKARELLQERKNAFGGSSQASSGLKYPTFYSTGSKASPEDPKNSIFRRLVEDLYVIFEQHHNQSAEVVKDSKEALQLVGKFSAEIFSALEWSKSACDAELATMEGNHSMVEHSITGSDGTKKRLEVFSDSLSVSLAVWELSHVLLFDLEHFSAIPMLLAKWYVRHYFVNDIGDYFQNILDFDLPQLWVLAIKLAQCDCKDEVIAILNRVIDKMQRGAKNENFCTSSASDPDPSEQVNDIYEVLDFIKQVPSLHKLSHLQCTKSTYQEYMYEMRRSAKSLKQTITDSSAKELLSIYAGEKIFAVDWIENLLFTFIWKQSAERDYRNLGSLLEEILPEHENDNAVMTDPIFRAIFARDFELLITLLSAGGITGGNVGGPGVSVVVGSGPGGASDAGSNINVVGGDVTITMPPTDNKEDSSLVFPGLVAHLVDVLFLSGHLNDSERGARDEHLLNYGNYLQEELGFYEGAIGYMHPIKYASSIRGCFELWWNSLQTDTECEEVLTLLQAKPAALEVLRTEPSVIQSACWIRCAQYEKSSQLSRALYWATAAEQSVLVPNNGEQTSSALALVQADQASNFFDGQSDLISNRGGDMRSNRGGDMRSDRGGVAPSIGGVAGVVGQISGAPSSRGVRLCEFIDSLLETNAVEDILELFYFENLEDFDFPLYLKDTTMTGNIMMNGNRDDNLLELPQNVAGGRLYALAFVAFCYRNISKFMENDSGGSPIVRNVGSTSSTNNAGSTSSTDRLRNRLRSEYVSELVAIVKQGLLPPGEPTKFVVETLLFSKFVSMKADQVYGLLDYTVQSVTDPLGRKLVIDSIELKRKLGQALLETENLEDE